MGAGVTGEPGVLSCRPSVPSGLGGGATCRQGGVEEEGRGPGKAKQPPAWRVLSRQGCGSEGAHTLSLGVVHSVAQAWGVAGWLGLQDQEAEE